MAFEPKKTVSASKKLRKNPTQGRQRKLTNKKDVVNALREFASDSSIHGIQYLGDHKHSTCGRVFWMITVCIALACTSSQVFNIWYQWIDDPVETILNTISLPVEEIQFPAVTLCPQGSTEDIIDSFFYYQFQEWLLNNIDDEVKSKRKRDAEQKNTCECRRRDQGNITADVLQCCFKDFLDNSFPGIYPNSPTKLTKSLNTEDPDKELELKSIVIPDDEPKCNETEKLEALNSMNEKLKRKCPDPFQKINESTCITGSPQEMSYDEGLSYCKELNGADIVTLGSFEDLKTLGEFIGKSNKRKWR